MGIELMQVKRLVDCLMKWSPDAEVEFYLGKNDGPYEMTSIYSENSPGSLTIPGFNGTCDDKLVTIDLGKPGEGDDGG